MSNGLDAATRPFMYGKLHRVTVTDADLHYIGSITIDVALLEAAHILPHTRVDVVNINNGNRLQTYVIEGPRDSGVICLNGAAAHLFSAGDLAIIMGYEDCPGDKLEGRISRAIQVDGDNKITAVEEHVTPSLDDLGNNDRFGEVYDATG